MGHHGIFQCIRPYSDSPRKNREADRLTVVDSTLEFIEELIKGNGKFEINFRPSILDNLDHLQVFQDDDQIIRFINNMHEFAYYQINYQDEQSSHVEQEDQPRNPIPMGAHF